MQWNGTTQAGFTNGMPWLPVPASAATINVEAEKGDPNSLLTWYQNLIRLKKTNAALARGANLMLDTTNTKVLSWMRRMPGEPAVVVSVNFTADTQTVSLSIPGPTIPDFGGKVKTLLKTPGASDPESLVQIQLGPFGVYIGELR
jgi:glycosidase